MFPSWIVVLKFPKKVHFLWFCANQVCESNLYTYMHLKVLITFFQKMIWFRGVWCTVNEILAIEIQKRCWTCRNSTKFFDFKPYYLQTRPLPYHSQYQETIPINNTIFWKCAKRPFICKYVNCLNILRSLAEVSTLSCVSVYLNLLTWI